MIEKEKIELLRKKGETYRQIAHSFGVSLSCIYQIHNNKNINPLEHKLWSSEKRKLLGLPNIKNYEGMDGRNWTRELVRIRDNWTCQNCSRIWKKGERRFDVHHQDEHLEGQDKFKYMGKIDKENMNKMITLCHLCHMNLPEVKKKIGRSKNKI